MRERRGAEGATGNAVLCGLASSKIWASISHGFCLEAWRGSEGSPNWPMGEVSIGENLIFFMGEENLIFVLRLGVLYEHPRGLTGLCPT